MGRLCASRWFLSRCTRVPVGTARGVGGWAHSCTSTSGRGGPGRPLGVLAVLLGLEVLPCRLLPLLAEPVACGPNGRLLRWG